MEELVVEGPAGRAGTARKVADWLWKWETGAQDGERSKKRNLMNYALL